MMSSMTWSASCPVALSCRARSAVWCHPIRSSHTVAVSCERLTESALHYSRMSARLACLNDVAYRHVLQTIITQTQVT
jgi:hypothetical protein